MSNEGSKENGDIRRYVRDSTYTVFKSWFKFSWFLWKRPRVYRTKKFIHM